MTKPAPSSQAPVVAVEEAAFFRRIFDAHYDYVYHSLRRLGVHTRDLEDLAHDVFVEVWKNLTRYDRERPIKPWLFAFAFRFASDFRRLARHRTDLGVPDDAAVEGLPTAEDVVAARQGAALVTAALDAMPLEQRAVFVLYEIDETPMKEIAEALSIPPNTAYSRLRLARAAFAEHVASQRARAASDAKGATP